MARYDFGGRVAVVTGGGRGIGLAAARRLAQSGARIALLEQDAERLRRAVAAFPEGTEVQPFVVDVADAAAVQHTMEAVHAHFGRLDILVNNAGIIGPAKPGIACTPEEWRRVFSVNLDGAFFCSRSAIPFMVRGGWGRVVNVASIAGKEGNPNSVSYSSSKAGVIGMTKSLAKDLAQSGVLVNCVASGVVNTEILQNQTAEKLDYMRSRIPMGRMAEPDEAAALIVWLASSECSFSTGAVYDLSGGRATY